MQQATRIKASGIFFAVACLYAAVAVPLAVYSMTSLSPVAPGLIGPGHAHEMLFGFALALVAGYLLGSVTVVQLGVLLALWLAARGFAVLAPGSWPAAVLSPLFALVLAGFVVPKFRHAKKWRNRSVMPLLALLCILPAAYATALHVPLPVARRELLLAGILLLALLMAFMGGRVIAPAAGGAYYRIGLNLKERVQPRLEGATILLLAAAAVAALLPLQRYAGLAAVAGGTVIAARLYRWRLWRLPGRWDLWCLGVGYGWLALGTVLLGSLLLAGADPVAAVHVITVGALGTLSLCVMTRIHLQRIQQPPSRARLLTVAVGLIAAATVLRFAVNFLPAERVPLLWASAAGWSAAYLITALRLVGKF